MRRNDNDDSGPWSVSDPCKISKDEKVLITLKEHPFLENKILSAMAVFIMLFASFISYVILPQMLLPPLVLVFFVVSNTSFFFPSRYTFTEEKVIVDRIIYRKAFPWSRFRGYAFDRNGLFLSPTTDPDRFDRFRGVFLVMGKENRELMKPVLQEVLGGSR